MKTGLYGRDMPGSLDAVNGGASLPACLASRKDIERLEEGGEAGRSHGGLA